MSGGIDLRDVLISALLESTHGSPKLRCQRFLQGLSSDELEFIADYFGACILEPPPGTWETRAGLAARVAWFQAARVRMHAQQGAHEADAEHKMILLLEFLSRGARRPDGAARRTTGAIAAGREAQPRRAEAWPAR